MVTVNDLLKKLEKLIRDEVLTPAKTVDDNTLICLVEPTIQGIRYHQQPFEALSEVHQKMLRGKEKGQTIGTCRIVAIYHYWDSLGPKIWSTRKI